MLIGTVTVLELLLFSLCQEQEASFYLGFKVEFSLGMCVVSFHGRGTVFFFRNIGYSKEIFASKARAVVSRDFPAEIQ